MAVFMVVDALLIHTLPLPHPEQLVSVANLYRGSRVALSYPMLEELRRDESTLGAICGWSPGDDLPVEVNGHLEIANVRSVTGNYFEVLGAQPALGRLILPSDERDGNISPVVVIGYQFWTQHFARRPDVLNQIIHIDGKPFTIVGVTETSFTGMTVGAPPQVTIPTGAARLYDLHDRSLLWLFATIRLRTSSNEQQARAALSAEWPALLESTVPSESTGARREAFLKIHPLVSSAARGTTVRGDVRSKFAAPLFLISGAVALLLIVICTNLSGLTITRGQARGEEMNTRIMLGATRGQALLPFVLEIAALVLIATTLAMIAAPWIANEILVLARASGSMQPILDLTWYWQTFLGCALLSVSASLLIAVLPVWLLFGLNSINAPHGGGRTVTASLLRAGRTLTIGQVSASLIVLQVSFCLSHSLRSLEMSDPGYDGATVQVAALCATVRGYPGTNVPTYRKALLERIAMSPFVRSVSFSNAPLLEKDYERLDTLKLSSTPDASPSSLMAARLGVAPGFFTTVKMPLLSGRDFVWADDDHHPPVAIIDSVAAQRLFGDKNAIGEHIRYGLHREYQNLEIIGVVRTARLFSLNEEYTAMVYTSAQQDGYPDDGGTIVASMQGDASSMKAISATIGSFGHDEVVGIESLTTKMNRSLGAERMTTRIAQSLAIVALFLSALGLFGLLTYLTILRRQELSLRIALGSSRRRIMWIIVRNSLIVTSIGVACGIPVALVLTRLLTTQFLPIASDPYSIVLAALTLFLSGLGAGLLPALRVTQMNPSTVLKSL